MPVYSHTQLSVFEECPQRYKFEYIDRIRKREEQGIEAFVGSRVHETLQKLYEDLAYGKSASMGELLEHYQEGWRQNWGPRIRIAREGISEENYRDYGARCIENYYRRYEPFNHSQTLKTEFHLVFPLDSAGRYRIQGYVDRLARRSDGVYEIHDYKTGASLPTQAHVDADRQLALYQIGLMSCWNDVNQVELIWHYVGLDSMLSSRRSPEQLQELTRKTMALIDRIEQCRDFPPVKSALCRWCEYRSDCPIWRHPIAVESMTPIMMEADAGVRLANEYAAAKRALDSATARLNEARRQVFEYAQTEQTMVLQGNGVHVSVSVRERPTLPERGTDAWHEIEELVKTAGKWEDVAELSGSRLLQAVREGAWPRDLLEEVQKFISMRPVKSVRFSCDDDFAGAAWEPE